MLKNMAPPTRYGRPSGFPPSSFRKFRPHFGNPIGRKTWHYVDELENTDAQVSGGNVGGYVERRSFSWELGNIP